MTPRFAGGGITPAGVAAIVGLVLTIGAALLYAIHSAYVGGYYRTYGLPQGLFDRTWHSAVYGGSLQSLSIAAMVAAALFASGIMYVLFALVLGVGGSSPIGRNAVRVIRGTIGKSRVVPFDADALAVGVAALLLAFPIAISYGLYVSMLVWAEKSGTASAAKEMAMIRANSISEMSAANLFHVTVFYMEGTMAKMEQGINIDCQHNSVCAIRQANRTVIIPAKNILRIETKPVA